MTTSSFNLIFTIYLSLIFPHSGAAGSSSVVQPLSCTMSPDGVTSISCEYAEEVRNVVDVRLNGISPTARTVLCQKGSKSCNVKNIYMTQEDPENPKKWLFFIYKAEPKDANMTYEGEFTVSDKDDVHITRREKPVTLLQGQQEAEKDCGPCPSPPPAPRDQMGWVLIGLLVLLLLCICVITCLSIRLKRNKEEFDNGTYVEMRKGPLLRNAPGRVLCCN